MEAAANPADVEAAIAKLNSEILIETKIKLGAENMLQVQQSSTRGDSISRQEVLKQLAKANERIRELTRQLEQLRPSRTDTFNRSNSSQQRMRGRADSSPANTPSFFEQVTLKERSWSMRADQMRRRSAQGDTVSSLMASSATTTPAFTMQEVLLWLHVASKTASVRLDNLSKLIELLRAEQSESIPQLAAILQCVRPYLFDQVPEIRASAVRALRYLSTNFKAVQAINRLYIDPVLQRFLTRDKTDLEREQVIKLVRRWICIDAATEVSVPLLRMVIAIAEHIEDRLRLIAIETLCELALTNTRAVAQCGGIKAIVEALPDLPREVVGAVVTCIMILLDTPNTRRYFRRGVEVEMIVSAFSDSYYTTGREYEERLAAYCRALLPFMRHWTGIVYFCLDDRRAIKALVDSMRLPSKEVKMSILDLLQQIFHIKPQTLARDVGQTAGKASLRRTPNSPIDVVGAAVAVPDRPKASGDRLNLIQHYTGLLLIIFIESRLFEALIDVIGESTKDVSTKATYLIRELIDQANRLLPDTMAINVQSLPGLFGLASVFRFNESSRHSAIAALSHIDQKLSTGGDGAGQRVPGAGGDTNRQSQKRQVEQTKLKLGLIIDDNNFRTMVVDSGVLTWGVRDHRNWDWEAIDELFQGPLQNPKRLEELLKTTDFARRILDFYRPTKSYFSDMIITRANTNYIRVGGNVLTTLASHPDGILLLSEHSLLDEIARSLSEIDMHKMQDSGYIFSAINLEKTLSVGYFALVGALMKCIDSASILGRVHMFSLLYHATEATEREDLLRTLIVSLDYSIPGHARTLMEKVVTSSSTSTRLFATNHLRMLLRSSEKDMSEWLISILVNQLYDPAPRIIHAACRALDEACEVDDGLATLVRLQPSLDHVLGIEDSLFLRFLSSSAGFRYLSSLGYIEQQMRHWFDVGMYVYVDDLERALWQTLALRDAPTNAFERGRFQDLAIGADEEYDYISLSHVATLTVSTTREVSDGSIQPHFYGELAKTQEGYLLLQSTGHVTVFATTIRQALDPTLASSETVMRKIKAAMWAVGAIGSTKLGFHLLEQTSLVPLLIDVARRTETISIKGTCFHVLGLISKCPKGWEALHELGWHSKISADGVQGSGVCLPQNLEAFLEVLALFAHCAPSSQLTWGFLHRHKLPVWEHSGSSTADPEDHLSISHYAQDDIEKELLQAVCNIANHILANAAIKTLHRLRAEKPSYFVDLKVYTKVQYLLGHYTYRFTARKFVHELFDAVDLSDMAAVAVAEQGVARSTSGRNRQLGHRIAGSINGSRMLLATASEYDVDVLSSVRSLKNKRPTYYADDSSESLHEQGPVKLPSAQEDQPRDLPASKTVRGFNAGQ
ncbi:hypothetical protein RI367_002032 [Sorochytrium milnesiophthora]